MANLLKITPQIIEFPVVLCQSITSTLRLENISHGAVAFKIKTTAPKNYLVRPSTGVIQLGETQEVQIILQPLISDPQAASDRFLVQSTLTPGNVVVSRDFWVNIPKSEVFDQRLSVHFKRDAPFQPEMKADGDAADTNFDRNPETMSTVLDGVDDNHAMTAFSAPPSDPALLKERYEQLIQYCVAVEKDKSALKRELETLRSLLELTNAGRMPESNAHPPDGARAAGAAGGAPGTLSGKQAERTGNFELWHVVAIVVVVIIALKLVAFV